MQKSSFQIFEWTIRLLLAVMMPILNEYQRRMLLGTLCIALGHGSRQYLAEITKTSVKTISRGKAAVEDLRCCALDPKARNSSESVARARKPGGGRKPIKHKLPRVLTYLHELLDGFISGNPMDTKLWVSQSLRNIQMLLVERYGINISPNTIAKLLKVLKISSQQNRKYTEAGKQHPKRDRQFGFIKALTKLFKMMGCPVLSLDSKKKELIGNFKNAGKELRPQGDPRKVNDHDFKLPDIIKAVPYGIYDVIRNIGFVCVGISADTAQFAAASLTTWWEELGKDLYPNAKKIMITCDCGGSNGARVRLWKYVLQQFANATGLEVHVCHYPPGTSKWNKIEHRLFSFISKNWAGRPLETLDIMLNYIANTVTKKGLKVYSRLDTKQYEKGIRISKKQMKELNLEYVKDWEDTKWNYIIRPQDPEARAA